MQKKEHKVGNETVYKEGRQRKKYSERDWKRSKYPKKSSNFGSCLITLIPLVGNISPKLQTSLLAILMIVKISSRREMVKTSFFRFSLAVTKVLTYTYWLNWTVFKTWDAATPHLSFISGTKRMKSKFVSEFVSTDKPIACVAWHLSVVGLSRSCQLNPC